MYSFRTKIHCYWKICENVSANFYRRPSTYKRITLKKNFFILLFCELFTPALAVDIPLEFEWENVSSRLQDSAQYSVLIMLYFGWFLLVFLFPFPRVPLPIFWWLYRAHRLKLVSPSLSCSIAFSVPKQGPGTYLSFRFLSILLCRLPGRQSPQFDWLSFFVDYHCSDRLDKIKWSVCISKSQRSLFVSFSRFWVMHIPFVRMVKLKFLARFPVEHLLPIMSYTLFVSICCIYLCDR